MSYHRGNSEFGVIEAFRFAIGMMFAQFAIILVITLIVISVRVMRSLLNRVASHSVSTFTKLRRFKPKTIFRESGVR